MTELNQQSKTAPTTTKILIAEDDDSSYEYLSVLLAKKNVKIIRTNNGEEAVNTLKKDKNFALVLMDLKMPQMDGLEATRLIREFNTEIPIIAQTAYVFSNEKLAAMEAGCNAYISKPIRRADFLSLVEQYLP
jgi:CheY-like chemotaxis protein